MALLWSFLALLLAFVIQGDRRLVNAGDASYESAVRKDNKPKFSGLYGPKYVFDMYRFGVERVTRKAKTEECKKKIESEFMKMMATFSEERAQPFEDVFFHSQCEGAYKKYKPMLPLGMKTPPRAPRINPATALPNNATIKSPEDISILYIVLIHDHADFAERLLRTLDEPQHTFVVHVDLKAKQVYDSLVAFQAQAKQKQQLRGKLHILSNEQGRENGAWGGFTLVNATLNSMKFAIKESIQFDYMVHLSGTTYPLVDNFSIRTALSQNPGRTYMDVHSKPNRPSVDTWFNFVECDGAVHRVSRLTELRGMSMFVGSQWFAMPWHVVHWFATNQLPRDYIHYAKHIVVADENYFATMFKNSPYCGELEKSNQVFVLFDKWENEKNANKTDRDPRKCLHPNPDRCGRSPTTLTMDYKRLLQASTMLFARKFDPENNNSMALVEEIDKWRLDPAHRSQGATQRFMIRTRPVNASGLIGENGAETEMTTDTDEEAVEDEDGENSSDGDAVGAAAAERVLKCVEVRGFAKRVLMRPCNASSPGQWFSFGRCTGSHKKNALINLSEKQCGMYVGTGSEDDNSGSDGGSGSGDSLSFSATFAGEFSTDNADADEEDEQGSCQLVNSPPDAPPNMKARCLDINGENTRPGANIITWESTGNWNQLFHYSPDCTMVATQPDFIAQARNLKEGVSRCLAASSKHSLVTSKCSTESTPLNPSADAEQDAADKDWGAMAPPKPFQQWQLLPEDGELWRQYEYNVSSGNASADVAATDGDSSTPAVQGEETTELETDEEL